MPSRPDFRDTVRARADRDPAFREALRGEVDDGRAGLRAYINATIGFEALSNALGRPSKSPMRMLGPSGNPTAENLLGVIGVLQAETGVQFDVRVVVAE
ncbi:MULTISPECIES: transcriptional regulator [unclassified Bradyrhizobium]|uniref:transcriptional regulator n=1 Tax=unclassified Bradyrhizobium TaxID=2631580 RepID=UPI0028E37912|nr:MULTISPECIES: transcriptional regulator [unclassified Bradyrhizobium]